MHFSRVASLLLAAVAASVSAQSPLKLIPQPRELRVGAASALSQGIQITCANPCSTEDAFAIDDLKAYFASQGVTVNASSAVNILVTRYGSGNSRSILADAGLKKSDAPADFPAEMKAEGYAIIPDGKGLAVTAASDAGIFYALQTVKQMVTG